MNKIEQKVFDCTMALFEDSKLIKSIVATSCYELQHKGNSKPLVITTTVRRSRNAERPQKIPSA